MKKLKKNIIFKKQQKNFESKQINPLTPRLWVLDWDDPIERKTKKVEARQSILNQSNTKR